MNRKLRILPRVLVAMFASCSPAQSEQMSKNAFSENKEVIDNKILWFDCLKQNEDHYLVFFYSETCSHCHEIMGDVIAFSEAKILKIYFSDIKESDQRIPISNDLDSTIGIDEVEDLTIAGTPTIIEVLDSALVANVPGKDNCLSFLNEQRLIHTT